MELRGRVVATIFEGRMTHAVTGRGPATMKGLLVTADGAVFRGISVGVDGVATGELVFNTAMTGYQEVLTDPSYAGQVVVMTSSHIGNYGVNDYDDQSLKPAASGMVVRSLSNRHSNWRAEGSFASLLHRHGLVALAEVDTRRLTRHVRDRGAMPVAIGGDIDESELARHRSQRPPHGGPGSGDQGFDRRALLGPGLRLIGSDRWWRSTWE